MFPVLVLPEPNQSLAFVVQLTGLRAKACGHETTPNQMVYLQFIIAILICYPDPKQHAPISWAIGILYRASNIQTQTCKQRLP